jgi:hypothetical protein
MSGMRGVIAAAAVVLVCWPALAEKRVALVIGNSAYTTSSTLPNPVNDAGDMAAALTQVGFEVILGLDLDKRGFDGKIRDFARALDQADVALFFYAGHGLQASGRNYLVPVDAQMKGERDLDFEGISADFILKQMELERAGKTNIVFLDACRDNPLARNLARTMGTRSTSIGSGLAQVQTGVGTFIAYSTQPGNVAIDGQGRNSPFTGALVTRLREAGRNLTSVMIDVRKDVLAATGGKQVPWDHSALTGDFYFQRASAPGMLPGTQPVPSDGANVQQRLRQLEDELKKKSDPEQTAKVVQLAQARERVRQLQEANRADQQKIFEVGRTSNASNNQSTEIGTIQIRMVRRSQEITKLREEIAQLEKDLGLTKTAQ